MVHDICSEDGTKSRERETKETVGVRLNKRPYHVIRWSGLWWQFGSGEQ